MELDEELLLSVAGGLGRMEEMDDTTYAYVASDDCLRAPCAFVTVRRPLMITHRSCDKPIAGAL